MSSHLTRRDILKTTGCAAAAALLGGRWMSMAGAEPPTNPGSPLPEPVLRLAHLTDIHLAPERRAPEGLAACLRYLQSQPDRPDLILTGGDLVMDSLEATFDRTKQQWELFQRVFKEECRLPVEHCLGNHDIWGWFKSKSGATGSEPQYGKKWAVELLGLGKPYRSFDRAGWHFIALDSITRRGEDYIGKLDDEQMAWLRADLAHVPATTPVLLFSHIPIFAACVLHDPKEAAEQTDGWRVPAGLMLVDSHRIRTLFAEHPNVRLCLSGHVHLQDRVDFNGVTYICDGAVSGAWWRGPRYECREGYGRIDLFADGAWNHRYVTYDWHAES